MMPQRWRGGRPPWWPASEPWPPQRHDRRIRARFFGRIALAAAVVLMFALSGAFAVGSMIAGRFGDGALPAALFAVVFVFVLLAAMFGAMRRFGSPLAAVMDAADRVAEGDYGVRVKEHGPPPMRALAHSFNTMTERLQNGDRLRRDLMADVSHELRTPLSILRGRIEGLLDGVYPRDDRQIAQLLEDTRLLSRLIEDLRTLALSDAGALQLQKEPTDVVGLIHDVTRSMRAEAARASMMLNVTTNAESAVIDLDPLRVREVLTNLVGNALRHAGTAGTVTVAVSSANDAVTVSVTDTGEGMSSAEIARMFDRFYKGATSQGSGLGLTIAKGIVTAHGGEIHASSRPGKGTTVAFTLPR